MAFFHLLNSKQYLIKFIILLIVIIQTINSGVSHSLQHTNHHHHHQHNYQRNLQLEDTERDLAFRALLCPEIPPDLLPIYRFHLSTRKCYEVGFRGPCGSNMIFVKQPFTRAVGKCVCKPSSYENTMADSRPLIHHPETNNCYFVYRQGYCTSDEWIVLDENNRPRCENNTCLELGTITGNEVEYREFVPLNGTCVELGVVSELCSMGQVVNFIEGRPGCTNFTLTDNEVI